MGAITSFIAQPDEYALLPSLLISYSSVSAIRGSLVLY